VSRIGTENGNKERDANNFPLFREYLIKFGLCWTKEEDSMDAYAPRIEQLMKRLYDSLAEDDGRRFLVGFRGHHT
jgi:hypothetical protein